MNWVGLFGNSFAKFDWNKISWKSLAAINKLKRQEKETKNKAAEWIMNAGLWISPASFEWMTEYWSWLQWMKDQLAKLERKTGAAAINFISFINNHS